MKKNIVLTLSSATGQGMALAKLIQANMSGITDIVPIQGVKGDGALLKAELDHTVTRDLKVFLVMPEFNGSFPAYFKEWIDNQGWPNQLKGMKVFLVGYSGSYSGNIMGVNHMKAVLDYIEADTYRHTSHFTYAGKNGGIHLKETEIFLNLIKQFDNE